jgi:hypothetical protein
MTSVGYTLVVKSLPAIYFDFCSLFLLSYIPAGPLPSFSDPEVIASLYSYNIIFLLIASSACNTF